MKRNRIFLLFIGVLAAVAVIITVIWNRPPESAESQPGLKISATELAEAFENDENKANQIYLNRVLEVQGTIIEIGRNQDGQQVLLLESSTPLSGVQCTMKDEKQDLKEGNAVTVKGFCNGFTSVVLLSDCVFTAP